MPAICPLTVACSIAYVLSPQKSYAFCLPEYSKVLPVSITLIPKSFKPYLYSAHEPITVTRYNHHSSPQTRIDSFDMQITKSRLYQPRIYRLCFRINLNRMARAASALNPDDASRIYLNLITDSIILDEAAEKLRICNSVKVIIEGLDYKFSESIAT